MAVLTSTTVIPLGDRSNRKQSVVMIPAQALADKPGVLVLQDVDDSAVVGEHYIWADSNGAVRVHTSMPTNQDSDGSALLTSASVTLDAAFDAGKAIDGSAATGAANAFSVGGAATDDKIELYHDGSKAVINSRADDLLITAAGGDVYTTGDLNITADNKKLSIGATDDTDSYLTFNATDLVVYSNAAIQFHTGADTDDYMTLTTTTNVPTIGTAGSCDLKITSSSGTIDFNDENLVTTGKATADGGLEIGADSVNLTFGASDATDSYIQFDGTNLKFYDSAYGTTATLSQLMAGTPLNPIVTGDLTISDGQFDWANATAGDTNTWSFANTTATALDITANSVTSAYIIKISRTDGAAFTGGYFQCHDGGAADFAIKRYGEVELAGNAGADMFTITAGDVVLSDGSITITDADNANTLAITNASVTDGTLAIFTADGLTSGSVLTLDADGGAGTGTYLLCYDGSANDLAIKNHGEIEITGNGGSDMLTISAGDVVLSDGSITITDADAATTLSLTNNTASTHTVVLITADGLANGIGIQVDADGGVGATGKYFDAYNGSGSVGSIGENGLLTLAGSAIGTDVVVLTAGDLKVTDGWLDVDQATAGNGGHNFATADDGTSNTSFFTIVNSDAGFDQNLLTIDANATGAITTMAMTNAGTGASLSITGEAAGSHGIKFDVANSATGQLIEADLGPWVGTANEGVIHLYSDAAASVPAGQLVRLDQNGTGQHASAIGGSVLFIEDLAAAPAAGTSYAMYINAQNIEALRVDAGAVLIDEKVTVAGMFLTPTDMTATDAGATISAGVSYVTADETTGDDGDILTLPTNVAGQMLIVLNDDAASDIVLTAAAGDTINGGAAAGAITLGEDECCFLFAIDGADWRAFKISGDGTLATAGASA